MPELPEVETVARQLAPRVVGRTLAGVRILDPLLRNGRLPRVRGRRFADVRRVGKQVAFRLEGGRGPLWLAVHLRMTGRLLMAGDGEGLSRPHLRARLLLDRGAVLFVDPRRFGTLRWLDSIEKIHPAGVDPTAPEFDVPRLAVLLGDSRQPLKAWLLRQDRLVGLGNIYASEILHAARLSPNRAAGSLDASETRRLHRATVRILRRAIEACGTTFSDFQDARGVEGSYQRYLTVYDRTERPCRRCRTPIRRIVQQQRSTYYCPSCQPD